MPSMIERSIDVDAGIDRTGGALAGRDECTNSVVVEDDAAKPVADNIGAQRHVNETGIRARHQIEEVEVEKRIAVEKQKPILQQSRPHEPARPPFPAALAPARR